MKISSLVILITLMSANTVVLSISDISTGPNFKQVHYSHSSTGKVGSREGKSQQQVEQLTQKQERNSLANENSLEDNFQSELPGL